MSLIQNEPLPDEARPKPTTTPSSSNMKFTRVLRRSSTIDNKDKQKEKDPRRTSVAEPERKSSLSNLPLRLRRRKTPSVTDHWYIVEEPIPDNNLGKLLFSLPSEILSEILTHLTLQDIYNLRLTSKSFHLFLNYNASTITRSILSIHDPTTPLPLLYPTPPSTQSLHHLLSTLRRSHNAIAQTRTLLSFVQMKIYMTRTATRVLSVSDNRQRLIDAFHRPAWFLTHFLESYRSIVTHVHPSHDNAPNCSSCEECKTLARAVVATYPESDIMPTYHFWQLTLQHLQIATRAPSSAGALERKLRGWGKGSVTEEILGIFVILGGMPEVRKVAMMQGSYNSRLGFVMEFVDRVRNAVHRNETVRGGSGSGSVQQQQQQQQRPSAQAWIGDEGDGTCARERTSEIESGRQGEVMNSLSPPFHLLTQDHITSLPDVNRFFYDIWKDRILERAPAREDIAEPYPWLQRVMLGSGVEFSQATNIEPSPIYGAPPV